MGFGNKLNNWLSKKIEDGNTKQEELKKENEKIKKNLKYSIKKKKERSITCPSCEEKGNFTAFQKGYGVGKGLAGAALFGPLGLAGGFIGSKKIYCVCNQCGHKWVKKF